MSDELPIVRRLNRTPLYTGSGELSALPEEAADEIDALSAELAAAKEALEPFAKLNVTRFMTDGIKYEFRVDAKDIRRARALAKTGETDNG